MNKIIVKIGSLAAATKFVSTPVIKRDARIYITSSLYAKPPFSLRCFTSNSSSDDQIPSGSDQPNNPDVHNLSREELKERIERYFARAAGAVPDTSEGISKRKLAGTHAESDDLENPDVQDLSREVDKAFNGDTSDDDVSINPPA